MNVDADTSDGLTRLARQLASETDFDQLLLRVVHATLSEVDGAEHAGVSLLDRHSITTPVATDDLVRRADHVQYATREGPCLQAVRDDVDMIRVDDLRAETRWPRFTPPALELGVAAVLSFQLYARGDTIGALNIYATRPHPFTAESERMGALLATHAAVALAATRKELNLQTALRSRDTIGQAKGILMERLKINADEAFNLLIAVSQHTHRKLRDVADELTSTGELRGL